MLPRPIRVRRGRRTDLIRILEILAASGEPMPPADRAMLRRFRRIVADLGADLYVATLDERVAGFVHVSYARQLGTAARARIENLAATPDEHFAAVCARLLECSIERAAGRECCEITWHAERLPAAVEPILADAGWTRVGPFVSRVLLLR